MMSSPYTYSNFPAVRSPASASAWPSYEETMEAGRVLFARWNQPMRSWPASEDIVSDIHMGRLLLERDKQRLQRRRLKLPKLTDTPRILPFRGEILKRAWQRFVFWHSKRQAWKEQDVWLRSSRKNSHPIFG